MEFFSFVAADCRGKKGDVKEYFFMALTYFPLVLMLEALHITRITSNKQCWNISNQMVEFYTSFKLPKAY